MLCRETYQRVLDREKKGVCNWLKKPLTKHLVISRPLQPILQSKLQYFFVFLPAIFFTLLLPLPSLFYFYLPFSTSASSILPLPYPFLPPTSLLSPPPIVLQVPMFLFQSQRKPSYCKRIKNKEKTGQWLIEIVLRELDCSLVVENKILVKSRNIGFSSLLIK